MARIFFQTVCGKSRIHSCTAHFLLQQRRVSPLCMSWVTIRYLNANSSRRESRQERQAAPKLGRKEFLSVSLSSEWMWGLIQAVEKKNHSASLKRRKKTRRCQCELPGEELRWWGRARVIRSSVICLLDPCTPNMLWVKEMEGEREKETRRLIHLASVCCCSGPVVTSETEDEHERELQWSPFTSKRSALNYSKSKYRPK